jgi:hypothetical protein
MYKESGRVWLHSLEVRYATVRPFGSLPLFRLLDRLRAGSIWIGGIQFQFERQHRQFSFIRIFWRILLSLLRWVLRSFAFECGITRLRWLFEPGSAF